MTLCIVSVQAFAFVLLLLALLCLVQVHLGLLEGRVSHIVWPPTRMGRVPVKSL